MLIWGCFWLNLSLGGGVVCKVKIMSYPTQLSYVEVVLRLSLGCDNMYMFKGHPVLIEIIINDNWNKSDVR